MNSKCTINPNAIGKLVIKRLATYVLIFHIMSYFDTEMLRVKLDVSELVDKYNISRKTIKFAIQELLDNKLIKPANHYRNWYFIDRVAFISFVERTGKAK